MAMLMTAIPASDPSFPLLDKALNAHAAEAAFGAALAGQGFRFESLICAIERCRIKRGRKALIGYRLTGRTEGGATFDQPVMVTLFPGNDPKALPSVGCPVQLAHPAFGPPVCEVAGLGGRAWFFPNDRKVTHLAELVAGAATQVIHYVPEQGCTVRRTLADGSIQYGKCRADDRGQVAAKVAAAASELPPKLRLAQTVLHDPQRRILWQQGIAGQAIPAETIISDPALWAGRVAEALSVFQAIPVQGLKQLTPSSIGKAIVRRIERMMPILPRQSDRLRAFAHAWQLQSPAPEPLVLAHGDLHSGNLLWDGTSFALIDLDTAAHAPRAADLGTLTASLVHKAVETGQPDGKIDALIHAFSAATGSLGCEAASFDWCLAGSLIGERLYRCTTRLKSPSPLVRDRVLSIAENWIARHA